MERRSQPSLDEESWRRQYQLENEDNALARALELSRLEHLQRTEKESRMQRDEPTRGEEPLSKSCSLSPANVQRQQQDREETQLLRNSSRGAVTAGSAGQGVRAIPLCLPNNCKWDSKTLQCVRTGEKRSSLYVVDEALERLRNEKGIY
ncbi:uncharacterized protein LOC110047873 [Orbicella faveolata]|uniref:uncharacterized protein LOC110047873 n=1 Tax=Orbicella faveolata TaxID=48498 RepID=UPI0009E38D8B|nr:uncharacterized protein LOC110047873 [Orbicella faveolata]